MGPDGDTLYFTMQKNVMPDIYRKRLTETAPEEALVTG
jgi:hypothetical protein